jgi:spore photoproduct lyase
MINQILIENELKDHPRVKHILSQFNNAQVELIDQYDNYFGKTKKPYLYKREGLTLYLAQKKGDLVKLAPPAYGEKSTPHYYYIHAYNCIYECEYCYLQGYFSSPDLVLFMNHEDIIAEMVRIAQKETEVWFHAGEFSDSLAMSHVTQEFPLYLNFLDKNPNAKIELRTKSVNIQPLLNESPRDNLIVSFSLSPESQAKTIDKKTPSIKARIKVMQDLKRAGFKIAIHFDPIVYEPNFVQNFLHLITLLNEAKLLTSAEYYSLGVVRFTKDVYKEVQRNYPDSLIHTQKMISSFDGKVRYTRPMRLWMMNQIKELLIKQNVVQEKIYLCMEND